MRPLLILCALLLAIASSAQIEGIIYDDQGQGLPAASILLLPDSTLYSTGIDGHFHIAPSRAGHYDLLITYVGYQPHRVHVHLHDGLATQLKIYLKPQDLFFQTITVTEEHAKQEESLSSEHFTSRLIEENLQGAFAKSIEAIAGISAINVGVGIAKPVIRGLSANRIIVNHQGVKQESQQWGSDHGLEIDPFDATRVEIIKGPGALQYGSDGLGGVINILPPKIPAPNTYSGSVLGLYKTNNAHIGGSAHLDLNVRDYFLHVRYSQQSFADYRVPASTFTYNGFTLPIIDERLKNTAGQENNISLTGGLSRDWGVTRLHFSRYDLQAGFFSGAVGVPRAYTLNPDGNLRDLDVPRQSVTHYRATWSQLLYLGAHHFSWELGYQHNQRREFSQPEFHSIPTSQITPGDNLAMALDLRTLSLNAHFEQHLAPHTTWTHGLNAQWQDNQRAGFEYLLPDFRTFRSGVFTLIEHEQTAHWTLNAGLRLDAARNQNADFLRYVYDSNENIQDSLTAIAADDRFFNWSASVGSSWTLRDGQWRIKAHLGKSFRVPYPVETASNGVHHGTFRHERGTLGLRSEHGYQLDLSTEWRYERLSGSFATYLNYFQDYIYLGPTAPARFSPLPEAGQIFQYRQDDAIYTGFELTWDWDFVRNWSLHQAIDFVQSYNLNTGLALPFTPQPSIRTDLRYELNDRGRWQQLFAEIGHQYHFAAQGPWRVDRTELETPAYQLMQIGFGADLRWWSQPFSLKLQVQNLWDTAYLAHLSRYRLINVPEQGRNIVISLKVPFGGKW